jgi:hypothetical protein
VRPYLEKILITKRAGEVIQGKGPEFKPQYRKEKKIVAKTVENISNIYWKGKIKTSNLTKISIGKEQLT